MSKKQFAKTYQSMVPESIAKAINDDMSTYRGYHIANVCLIRTASAVLVIWEEKDKDEI